MWYVLWGVWWNVVLTWFHAIRIIWKFKNLNFLYSFVFWISSSLTLLYSVYCCAMLVFVCCALLAFQLRCVCTFSTTPFSTVVRPEQHAPGKNSWPGGYRKEVKACSLGGVSVHWQIGSVSWWNWLDSDKIGRHQGSCFKIWNICRCWCGAL